MERKGHRKDRIRNACVLALVIVVLLSLIPALYFGRYTRMEGDDFTYGMLTHRAIIEGRGLTGIIQAVWERIAGTYRDWQGTYSAVALFALQPGVWVERLYVITPYFLIGSLVAGLGYFLYQVCSHVLRAPRYVWFFAWMITVFLCVQFPRNAMDGFYWYNGGVFYVFFFALMLVALGYITRSLFSETIQNNGGGGGYAAAGIALLPSCGW